MHLKKTTKTQKCTTSFFTACESFLSFSYLLYQVEIWLFASFVKRKKNAFMYKYYWHCYPGRAWWGEISCCKGDSSGEKEAEILLSFVYRNKLNKKLEELLEIFPFLSLTFPCTVWLLLFILQSLKQDPNSFTCSTAAVCRQSHFCAWKMKISENAVKAVCHTKVKLQCYS